MFACADFGRQLPLQKLFGELQKATYPLSLRRQPIFSGEIG
jgi:hypothetical protein